MLISRIVGVLCCLALCGCLWQPPRYLPPPPPSPVIQAKDYVVALPKISWSAPSIDVHFKFLESKHGFARDVYAELKQRNILNPIDKISSRSFVVSISNFEVDAIYKNVESERLYFRPSTYAELIQFNRIHFSFIVRTRADIVVTRNGKTLFKGQFDGRIPDGKIYCTDFQENYIEPGWRETIYLWPGVRRLCRTRDELTDSSIVQRKTAEIFAGDMEELIVGLMKP